MGDYLAISVSSGSPWTSFCYRILPQVVRCALYMADAFTELWGNRPMV